LTAAVTADSYRIDAAPLAVEQRSAVLGNLQGGEPSEAAATSARGILLIRGLSRLGYPRQPVAIATDRPNRLDPPAAPRSRRGEDDGLAVRGDGQGTNGIAAAGQLTSSAGDPVEVDFHFHLRVTGSASESRVPSFPRAFLGRLARFA